MVTRTWDPIGDLLRLQERLNELLQASLAPGRPESVPADASWIPAADAWETAEGFVVQLDLPGVEERDLLVQVHGERLLVSGRRRAAARPASFHRMERSSGAFARSFQLPEKVDGAQMRMTLRDGLLRLELPKLRRRPRAEKGA
ncbi:MAG TPA: Hsp20/alpha crystallin family protein [Vicinamibacteria bacterium]|nr:Hsp20/alpha crystallin family protein [Vicinamibacteria bacterium]